MESKLIVELIDEHRCIERLIASLLRGVARAKVGDDRTKLLVAQHLELFRTLLDGLHHGREEEVLFEALCRTGMSRTDGSIGVLSSEHELARSHLVVLARIALSGGVLREEELADLGRHVSTFAQLLTTHIAKEDAVIYPMARARLGTDGLNRVDAAAGRWVGHSLGERIRLMALADQIGQRTLELGVASAGERTRKLEAESDVVGDY